MKYYWDIKSQNEWLRENILDPMGNYLFCARCICQRNVKRSASSQPIVDMEKGTVMTQKLGDLVVILKGIDEPFLVW